MIIVIKLKRCYLQILELDELLKQKESWNILRGVPNTFDSNVNLVFYKIDCNIDGVVVFKCSEQGEVIPILCSIHSITKSAKEEHEITELIVETRFPFVVGFFHGQTKPEPEDLVAEFLNELIRLDPENSGPETDGRKCTASLHCMKCDTRTR